MSRSIADRLARLHPAWLGGSIAVLAALACLLVAIGDHGIYHPDELYQSLEPAHRWVFGYGLQSWEWEVGARTPLLPASLVPLIEAASWLGDSPLVYLWATRIFLAIAVGLAAWATFGLARAFGATRAMAAVAGILFLGAPLTLYFGHRALSGVLSMPLVAGGFLLSLASTTTSSRRYVGVALVGLSVFLRLQNALWAVGLLAVLAARRDRRALREALAALAVCAIALALVDLVAWGEPFHSAAVYLRYNLVADLTTESYGASPPWFYVTRLVGTTGLFGVFLWVAPLLAGRRAAELTLCAFGFVLAHSFVGYKEMRFMLPALPLLAAAAGVGLQRVLDHLGDATAEHHLAAGALISGLLVANTVWLYPRLTFGDLGQADFYEVEPTTSAHDYHGPINRLYLQARQEPELCGLLVPETIVTFTGGHSYLHRDVPIFSLLEPPASPATYNYLISRRAPSAPSTVVATDGRYSLHKMGRRECAPAPGYRGVVNTVESR